MRRRFSLVFLLLVCLFLSSCFQGKKGSTQDGAENSSVPLGFSFETQLKYAKGFSIKNKEGYKLIEVYNPWDNNKVFMRYVLTPNGIPPADTSLKFDFLIRVPVGDVAVLSSTHIGPLVSLGLEGKIKGASNPEKIYHSDLFAAYEQGTLTNLGSAMAFDMEKLLELSPDVIFKSGFNNSGKEMQSLKQAGLNVAYNLEWMESDMLARAEWIKFMSAFFLKEKEADSIFKKIEQEYFSYREIALASKERPGVLFGSMFKGTWYMPGGQSYKALLLKDAGSDYYYKNDSSKGSLHLSFEVVLEHQLDCKYWIGLNVKSKKDLLNIDERYNLFKAFKDGELYMMNKRMNKNGGNDYWESGVVNPHKILGDYIKILHPDLLPDYELFYHGRLVD